ncbi:MAG: hypothetical protein IKQ18_06515 [Clostridia bacterium]|nr:hypothetical protein [Clostridia bacterium]
MKNTQITRVIVIIGIIIIFISFVLSVVLLVKDMINVSDPIDRAIVGPAYIFMMLPVILEEISLLRSVYKLARYRPVGAVRICYIISAAVVVCALTFQILYFTKIITPTTFFPEGPKAASSRFTVLFLIVEWSAIIVSFILGSFKSTEKTDNGAA